MATKKSFGFERNDIESTSVQDFVQYSMADGDRYNPLRKELLPHRSNYYQGSITSIPSPYARMHVTDIAFEELTSGIGIYSNQQMAKKGEQLSEDYTRAISHCLDIYELLFYADGLNLKEAGITIHKIKLWHLNDRLTNREFLNLVGDNDNNTQTALGSYIQTLDLYRDQYMEDINRRKKLLNPNQKFKFDFSSLYIFKHRNKTFAATSPFTGFFAKADCDLSDINLSVRRNNGQQHKLLTSDNTDYASFDSRDNLFKEFMYELFREVGLDKIYINLFNVIKNDSYITANQTRLDHQLFSTDSRFKKFNIGGNDLLQKIEGVDAFVRPDGIDCSYLKFLLYQVEPADLTIPQISYLESDISKRQFPEGSGQFIKWLGANDILSDALFVLPYEINEEYKAITYYDENDGKNKRRCLIPIKTQVLDYIGLQSLIDNMELIKRNDNSYLLRLTIHLQNGGTVVLRREYFMENMGFPYGKVVCGEDMKPFAFGIYPFVHSDSFNNIYKVLFYNAFERVCSVDYYVNDNTNLHYVLMQPTNIHHNTTNKLSNVNNALPANCNYYNLDVNGDRLAFANIFINSIGNALIVPEIKVVPMHAGETIIAVDLGTSNTYVAYTHQPEGMSVEPIHDINTHHGDWNELIFMNKRCERNEDPNAQDKNRDDLYLNQEGVVSHECLSAQLSEFIPSQIGEGGYTFPIPSAVNMLRIDDARVAPPTKIIPLVNSSIPFAYYEIGTRKSGGTLGILDAVSDGSDFKWFCTKNAHGMWSLDATKQHQFEAFMQELLFILRSNMLSMGYDLNSCKVIWSYPLSFAGTLVSTYQQLWNKYFSLYFNHLTANVIKTNESLTPIYYCETILATGGNLSLLVDIGGGSTDIIGYKDDTPQFITSFGFAGNALYLEGSMNNSIDMNTTLLKRLLKAWDQEGRITTFSRNTGNDTQPISIDSKVSVLMNYGFSTDAENFSRIFDDDPMRLLLSLHNAAIMYQIAQLCKLSEQEIPLNIYLTGNGSKLLKLNHDLDRMFKAVFQFVYGIEANHLNIQSPMNPKYATAQGALKGIHSHMAINDDANEQSKIMLGDGEHIYSSTVVTLSDDLLTNNNYKSLVKENVRNFLQFWYSQLDLNLKQQISEGELLNILEIIATNQKLTIQGGVFSDSLFFQYISLIMEVLSQILKVRIYGNN